MTGKDKSTYFAVVTSMIIGGGVCADSTTVTDSLERMTIVFADVVESDGNERQQQSIQIVSHVYCGSDLAIDSQFVDWSAQATMSGYEVWPPLEIGQEGLWLLRQGNDGMIRRDHLALGIEWPVRRGVESRYEQVLQLAESLEAVWHADSEKQRVKLLLEYSLSDVPEVSIGAIMVLQEGAPNELAQLVRRADLKSLSLRTQLAIDQSMMRVEPTEWRNSENRKAMLAEWRKRLTIESEAFLIIQRLDIAIQRKEIEATALLEMLQPIVTDADLPATVRNRAILVLRWIAPHEDTRQAVFDLLTPLLEGDVDIKVAKPAVQTLSKVEALDDERMAKLILLRDAYQEKALQIEDKRDPIKRIATTLDETVRRLQKPKGPGEARP